jgi:predicted nucleic acid-binding Zn ribbon protein
MDTKQCPYCGEEILTVAKKCKYCGEWIEKEVAVVEKKMVKCPVCAEEIEDGLQICSVCKEPLVKKQEEKRKKSSTPNYRSLSILCYVAVFLEIIYAIRQIAIPTESGWQILILSCFFFVYLMLGLRKHYMITHSDKPIPFIALICLFVGMNLMSLTTDDADYDYIPATIKIILFLGVISCFILKFIVGFQLNKRLKEASSVGILMMIGAVVVPIILILFAVSGDDETWVGTIIESGFEIVFFFVLSAFFRKIGKQEIK